MKYQASIRDFFHIPQWKMNVLLGAVTMLIPIVGPIVLSGWYISVMWARGGNEDPATFPPFDFQHFGKYLERGLWPFLVSLVASLVLIPLLLVCCLLPFSLLIAMNPHHHSQVQNAVFPLLMIVLTILQIALTLLWQVIAVPPLLRATIAQDFKAGFDLKFAKDFIAKTWRESLLAALFMFGLGICMIPLMLVTCYIGGFFAAPVLIFSWQHLQKQLYHLYLSRGGEIVPLSPKLRDLPPLMPQAA